MSEPKREGDGRWTAVRKPAGVLWESATGVGFTAAPNADPTAMLAAIAAGGTFDDLAAAFGTRVVEGDLGHWLPKRKERA